MFHSICLSNIYLNILRSSENRVVRKNLMYMHSSCFLMIYVSHIHIHTHTLAQMNEYFQLVILNRKQLSDRKRKNTHNSSNPGNILIHSVVTTLFFWRSSLLETSLLLSFCNFVGRLYSL